MINYLKAPSISGTCMRLEGRGMSEVHFISKLTVMERCNLIAVSAGSLSSGPSFTYLSGDVQTTVDYILADVEATSLMSDCRILPMDDLNTST